MTSRFPWPPFDRSLLWIAWIVLASLSIGACGGPPPESALTSGHVRAHTTNKAWVTEALVNEVPGRLSAEQIRRVVTSHKSEVNACYETEARTDPSLQGQLVLSWEILNDGSVSAPMVGRVTFDDMPLEECVLRTVRGWRFPASESQTSVETFRFDFPM